MSERTVHGERSRPVAPDAAAAPQPGDRGVLGRLRRGAPVDPTLRRVRRAHLVPTPVLPVLRIAVGDLHRRLRARHRLHVHDHAPRRRPVPSAQAPYVLAYVRLDEGPVVMTNIVGVDPETVEIGQVVEVVWEPAGESDNIPRFTPA